MYDEYIELTIQGITRGKELEDAYILILRAAKEDGFFPVLIDKHGFETIYEAMQNHDYTCAHMMNLLAERMCVPMQGMRILRPSDGKTMALVDFQCSDQLISITVPIAEAIVATLEKNKSIWVDKAMYERQIKFNPSDQSMALPITAMNKELLENALQSAVKEDNFELASILRDELNKRKNLAKMKKISRAETIDEDAQKLAETDSPLTDYQGSNNPTSKGNEQG